MDITWYGHATTRLRARSAAILNDPTDRSAGIDMARPTADIVMISREHPHHSHLDGVKGEFLLIDAPGEYESNGVQIEGIPTALLPAEDGTATGRNIAYLITTDGLHVAHLGSIGEAPTASEAETLSQADILILPVGDPEMISPAAGARIVRALEPKIVIPVCHSGAEDPALVAFLAAVGSTAEHVGGGSQSLDSGDSKVTVQRRDLGEHTRVLILTARGRA